MGDKPLLVSVVIPVYNAEKYLTECIDSVLSQKHSNLEVLLVDDGSMDQSLSICNQYMQSDSRVMVITQENRGVSFARNTGIQYAKGEYIAFLDSDDWWDKEFLGNMMRQQKDDIMVVCNLIRVLEDGSHKRTPDFNCDMEQWCWPIINNYPVTCCRCLFHSVLLKEHKILFTPGCKTGEDQEFTFKYMVHMRNVCFVSSAHYYYRTNNTSAMFRMDYSHYDAVEAMLSFKAYAQAICTADQFKQIGDAIDYYKCPYILEFATTTVLTAGEKPNHVLKYLIDNGYHKIIINACSEECSHDSVFMKYYAKSPLGCLRYFYWRRLLGRKFRAFCQMFR